MKTVINNEESAKVEFFKRILYSFQVLNGRVCFAPSIPGGHFRWQSKETSGN